MRLQAGVRWTESCYCSGWELTPPGKSGACEREQGLPEAQSPEVLGGLSCSVGQGPPGWPLTADLQAGPWDVSRRFVCRLSCVTVREDQGVWVELMVLALGLSTAVTGRIPCCSAALPGPGEPTVCRGAFLGKTPSVSSCLPPTLLHEDSVQPHCVPALCRHSWPPARVPAECASHGF